MHLHPFFLFQIIDTKEWERSQNVEEEQRKEMSWSQHAEHAEEQEKQEKEEETAWIKKPEKEQRISPERTSLNEERETNFTVFILMLCKEDFFQAAISS